jgi:hypothetical protein
MMILLVQAMGEDHRTMTVSQKSLRGRDYPREEDH